MSENEYKNDLRDKLDSRQFEANENNWLKLVPELEKLEKKKKRRFILYFFFAGIGILLPLFFIFQDTDKSVASKAITNQTPITSTENAADHQQDTYTGAPEKAEQHINSTTHGNITQTSESETSTGTLSNDQTANLPKNKKSELKPEKIQENKSGITEQPLKYHQPGKQQAELKKVQKESVPEKNATVLSNTSKKQETKTQNKNATEQTNTISEPDRNDSTEKITTLVKTEPEKITEANTNDSLAAISDTISKRDSTLTLSSPPASTIQPMQDPAKEKEPSMEFYVGAYLAFTPGYSGSFSFSEALNPSLGIGIRKFFKPTLGIGAGLFYTIYGNVGNDPKIFYSTQQEFGYKSSIVEIRQNKLHYLRMPVTFEFRFRKNIFSLGPEFMYLVTSSSVVQNYNEAYGSVTDKTSKKEYGYMGGYRRYDIGVILNYTRKLNERIYLSLLMNTGFIDVKNNTYFNDAVFDRNKSIQIGMNYKF